MQTIAKQIHQQLLQAENILLVSHKNPDGDTLASACAMMQYLRTIDKPHTAFCATAINQHLSFLPQIEYFVTDPRIFKERRFDTIVIFDSGDLPYAGVDKILADLSYSPVIINIDHHLTNEFYGHHNLVMSEAASTTEILYRFLKINNLKIDKYIATCLLTGVVTDTSHFSNPATTASSLKIAGELLRLGANLNLIRGWTFKNKSLAALEVWGKVLTRLRKNEKYDLAISFLTREDLKKNKLPEEETEGLINFLNNLNDARLVVLLKEKGDDTIKVSLRSNDPDIDISRLAKSFGGGGHAKAAGFSVKGRLVETEGGWQIV